MFKQAFVALPWKHILNQMRELTAFVHSNAKIQKRTDDAGKHGDRVRKGLAFPRSPDNLPIDQERKHRLWTWCKKVRIWGSSPDCLFSRIGSKVTRWEGRMETRVNVIQQVRGGGGGAGHKMGEGRWEIQACTYKMNKSQGWKSIGNIIKVL